MDEDVIWSKVGSFGKWQVMVCAILSVIGVFFGIHDFNILFVGGVPAHWCQIPQLSESNWTTQEIKEISIPREVVKGVLGYSECSRYSYDFSLLEHMDFQEALRIFNQSNNLVATEKCQSWVYDTSRYLTTIVSEWNLVCDRKAFVSIAQSVFLAGMLASCILCGYLADKFGRRPVLIVSSILLIASGLVECFAPNYTVFTIFRFLIALFSYGGFLIGFVLLTEIVGPKHRSKMSLYFLFFTLGGMINPGLAYLIRDWHYLQWAGTFPNVILILFIWFVPESPRWQITNGKYDEAIINLSKAAERNGKLLSDHDITDIVNTVAEGIVKKPHARKTCNVVWEKATVLFRTTEIRRRTIFSYFPWFFCSFCYYGLYLNSTNLPVDPYLVTFVMAASEIVSFYIPVILLDRIGRKPTTVMSFIISGVACFLVLAPPKSMGWIIAFLAIIGKCFAACAFASLYVFEAELYPTEIRSTGVGGASVAARLGGILSPYVVNLLVGNIPMVLFGAASLTSAFLVFFLPETKGKKFPETIVEVEKFRTPICPTSSIRNSLM